jgi:hypothetical protein
MKVFVLLIVVLLFVLWKKYQQQLKDRQRQDPGPPSGSAATPKARELLPCSVCGVHADKASLGLNAQGQYVCTAHGQSGP